MKYAFIFDCDIPSGEDFNCQVGFGQEVCLVAGVSPIEDALSLAQKLASQGFTEMGFCAAFDDGMISKIKIAVGAEVNVHQMQYLPEQLEMLGEMNSFREYGVLIQADGLTSNARFLLKNDSCNAKICFAPNWNCAKDAVKELFEEGIYFIECCGWFKESMVRDMIQMTCDTIPIGSTALEA
jgi:hypothetical protein